MISSSPRPNVRESGAPAPKASNFEGTVRLAPCRNLLEKIVQDDLYDSVLDE